ncbi:MAG: 23S rRNA (adenine(1618)-N(6))-methyltransferase RlmF [Bacteroidetes bacterium HGW-Bacteroidetes-1]|jgi:23S rRNA (adenine1618-N6)-methyltransferase|nr:MAG: 23S rRNA (adenine(1618)-N(6))-methyltransferase RlmF [Bacteroidetes bacterium HGW-Bacteroidetes-1]
MLSEKKNHPSEKVNLHPRNKHRERYDFRRLIANIPELGPFVKLNIYGDESIDFFNPEAVKILNKALLMCYYNIDFWDIPKNYLCPPIPGRADYLHHLADLLRIQNNSENEVAAVDGTMIKCLDIGVGANCVFPIIGINEYGWSFIGSDIDPIAIATANKIIEMNPSLKGKVELRLQPNSKDIFAGIIAQDECFDLTICNPPFHSSFAEAQQQTLRKLGKLKHFKPSKPIRNFGGQNNELWCEGGEGKFIGDMIDQSRQFSSSCFIFSTLVSKQTSLNNAYKALKKADISELITIPMSQGNKTSRLLAWSFLNPDQKKEWINKRWH